MVDYEASRSRYIIAFIVANFASNIAAKLGDAVFSASDYFNSAIRTGEIEQALLVSAAISGLLAVVAWIIIFMMFANIYFHRMLWYFIAGAVIGNLVNFAMLSKTQDLLGLSGVFVQQIALLSFAISMAVPMFFYLLRKDRYHPPVSAVKIEEVTLGDVTANASVAEKVSNNKFEPSLGYALEIAQREIDEMAFVEPNDSSQNSFIYEKTLDEWITLANNGDNVAQYNLGIMYDEGLTAPQDHREAVKWYRLAAEQGDAEAQNNLGSMYLFGRGILQDNILAHMWYNISSANGYSQAAEWRDEVAVLMSQEDIATAQTMARECLNGNYQQCGY